MKKKQRICSLGSLLTLEYGLIWGQIKCEPCADWSAKGCNSNFLASVLVSFIWGRVSPLGNESPFCKCLPLYLAEFMKTAPAGKCKLTIKLCWDPPPPPPQPHGTQLSLIQIFLSFLALIASTRQRNFWFYRRMDFTNNSCVCQSAQTDFGAGSKRAMPPSPPPPPPPPPFVLYFCFVLLCFKSFPPEPLLSGPT